MEPKRLSLCKCCIASQTGYCSCAFALRVSVSRCSHHRGESFSGKNLVGCSLICRTHFPHVTECTSCRAGRSSLLTLRFNVRSVVLYAGSGANGQRSRAWTAVWDSRLHSRHGNAHSSTGQLVAAPPGTESCYESRELLLWCMEKERGHLQASRRSAKSVSALPRAHQQHPPPETDECQPCVRCCATKYVTACQWRASQTGR